MQIVEVPGLGDVEFPDTMTDDQIAAEIGKMSYEDLGVQPQPVDPAVRAAAAQKVEAEFAKADAMRNKPAEAGYGALSGLAGVGNVALTPLRVLLNKYAPESSAAQGLEEMKSGNEALRRSYDDSNYFGGGKMGAEILATLPVGGAVAGTLSKIPGVAASAPNFLRAVETFGAQGGTLPTRLAGSAVAGAAQTAAVDPENAAYGALGAPVAALGLGAVSRVLKPQTDPAVKALLDEGVRLTPGKILGGTAGRLEDAMTTPFVLGDAISAARGRATEDLNRAVANRALGPIGQKLPDNVAAGRDLVNYVGNTLSDEYQRLLPNLQFAPDQRFATEFQKIQQMTTLMPEQQAKQFEAIVKAKLINNMTPQGRMNGESYKTAESALKMEARSYASAADPDQRKLGAALQELSESMGRTLRRSNPQHATELKNLNRGWANLTRLEAAAGMQGATDGVFNANQLSSAVRGQAGGVRKREFARGRALMQALSDAAKSTMPSTVNDSGTVTRGLATVAGLATGAVSPLVPLGLGAASALYSRPAQYVLRGALAGERPQAAQELAKILERYAPQVSAATALPLAQSWE